MFKPWLSPTINEEGHLLWGGCDTVDLAKTYGTPLYVLDEQMIRENCRAFCSTFENQTLKGRVLFASKALSNMAIYRIAASEGLGTDVVSAGELQTALKAGMPADRINFNGNNKTEEELRMALQEGVGRISIDSHEEIAIIDQLAEEMGVTAHVLLRVKPGVEAHTHEFITTGTNDSKFGLGVADGEAMHAVREILSKKNIDFCGIHAHIGSQIFSQEPFLLTNAVLMEFLLQVQEQCGVSLREVDFGGGYGISYTSEDTPLQPWEYVDAILENFVMLCNENNFPVPYFYIEPGRSLVCEAGITLYEVGTIKNIPGIRRYVSVNGGMGDNPRPALYDAQYEALCANKADSPHDEKVRLAGRFCESSDILIREISLPTVQRGDIIAVFSTGAYNYSMAMNYNRVAIPAMVLVNQGNADLIVKRQTIEQMMQNDLLPAHLAD